MSTTHTYGKHTDSPAWKAAAAELARLEARRTAPPVFRTEAERERAYRQAVREAHSMGVMWLHLPLIALCLWLAFS
jgi:hypothetical protein